MITNIVAPDAGRAILDGFVVFKLFGADTANTFAIVEHTLLPGMLAAPVHTHRNEDEYSYVLSGKMTALIGGELIEAPAGSLVRKPRGIPHTFWNQGDTVVKLLEIISPAGFERYFDELSQLLAAAGPPDVDGIVALAERYGMEMDFDSVVELTQKYKLWIGQPPA